MLSTGRNCAPAAATAGTPTITLSTVATSPLHHWYCSRIAESSRLLCSRLSPTPGEPEAADLFSAVFGRHDADVIALTRPAVNSPHHARLWAPPDGLPCLGGSAPDLRGFFLWTRAPLSTIRSTHTGDH